MADAPGWDKIIARRNAQIPGPPPRVSPFEIGAALFLLGYFKRRRSTEPVIDAPENTVLPAITGTATVGQTLSVDNGTWTGSPASYAYQWKADGVAIEGATASTYELTDEEIGAVITATVTATNAGGSTAATSEGTAEVQAAPITDPHFANVVLLLGFDGADGATSSTDESPSGHALTFVGDAQIDTAQSKFGGASLQCDGTGDEVTVPDGSDQQFPGEFTMECFFRTTLTSTSSQGLVVKYGASGSRSFELAITRAGAAQTVRFRWSTTGTSADHFLSSSGLGYALNTWYHLAADRDSGGTMRLYFNGTMVASKAGATGENADIASTMGIGRAANGGIAFQGHIDEVRITKGVARYASDAGFTVPAAAFPRS